MRSRPSQPRPFAGRLAAILLASTPLPALAAYPALAAWGAYPFFAIVATVVIVLLLHEALDEDEPIDTPRRAAQDLGQDAQDERAANQREA